MTVVCLVTYFISININIISSQCIYYLTNLTDYTVIKGGWLMTPDGLQVNEGTTGAVIWIGNTYPESLFWNKYRITVNMRLLSTESTRKNGDAGILFNALSVSDINNGGQQMYFGIYQFTDSTMFSLMNNSWKLIDRTFITFHKYLKVKLSVVVDSGYADLYIDDKRILYQTELNYKMGSIGLRSYLSGAIFESVVVDQNCPTNMPSNNPTNNPTILSDIPTVSPTILPTNMPTLVNSNNIISDNIQDNISTNNDSNDSKRFDDSDVSIIVIITAVFCVILGIVISRIISKRCQARKMEREMDHIVHIQNNSSMHIIALNMNGRGIKSSIFSNLNDTINTNPRGEGSIHQNINIEGNNAKLNVSIKQNRITPSESFEGSDINSEVPTINVSTKPA
mmetsp:Transcript_41074/g.50581  ORF Transcript_41074/g.50581 Transcript_41074/m.50581 type:complete len:395 (+) Transcript_41074:37-1221(+)